MRVIPIAEYGLQRLQPTLFALLGVVGFVLLIACVNVANLMLARAATRYRELAIRCALGAGRGRMMRQLLTESVLLGVAGGVSGLILAYWGTQALFPALPDNLRRLPMRPLSRIDLDLTVLAFTAGVSVLSGVLFGLVPAVAAFRTNLNDPLKDSARGSTGGRSRLRYGLVASEVALTLVVLAGAGVMIVSVARLLGVDPGLDTRNVLVMQMSLPQENLYYGPPGNPRFCEELATAGRRGARRAVGERGGAPAAQRRGRRPRPRRGRAARSRFRTTSPARATASPVRACCRTLGIDLVRGREFTAQDSVTAPGVVADQREAGAAPVAAAQDAVGKRFKIGRFSDDAPWLTVVGVMKNIRHGGLDNDPYPWFVRPYSQAGWPVLSILDEDGVGAGLVRRAGQGGAADRRAEPAGDERADDGRGRRRVGGVAPIPDVPAERVRAARAGARRGRDRGRGRLLGGAAHAGDWRADGARRPDARRAAPAHRPQPALDARWASAWGFLRPSRCCGSLGNLLYEVKASDPTVLGSRHRRCSSRWRLAASYLPARRASRIDSVDRACAANEAARPRAEARGRRHSCADLTPRHFPLAALRSASVTMRPWSGAIVVTSSFNRSTFSSRLTVAGLMVVGGGALAAGGV